MHAYMYLLTLNIEKAVVPDKRAETLGSVLYMNPTPVIIAHRGQFPNLTHSPGHFETKVYFYFDLFYLYGNNYAL